MRSHVGRRGRSNTEAVVRTLGPSDSCSRRRPHDTTEGHMSEGPGGFDRLASAVGRFVSHAPFFAACLGFVLIWAALLPTQGWNNQIWHLWLNSPTTSITFLLVALLQNTQARFEKATNEKLNAIADALADLMDHQASKSEGQSADRLRSDVGDLKRAVGIEEDVGA